jgi:hypothetical protein
MDGLMYFCVTLSRLADQWNMQVCSRCSIGMVESLDPYAIWTTIGLNTTSHEILKAHMDHTILYHDSIEISPK